MTRRKLPIGGVQTFWKLRDDYDVYVDKTKHIYDIASRYNMVFLARPRRFGKSLLCSTFEVLFSGQKDQFDGLAISKTDWEWKSYPVIYIDLGASNYTQDGKEALNAEINKQLFKCAEKYNVNVDLGKFISINFSKLVYELSDKIGKVVVIIDEYDNPLLSTIDNPELNKEIREELKGFYSVIKQSDRYLRFAFVTGVTKFAQVSVFSGFNQPKDISMMPEYCDICGITQEELENYFAQEIEAYAPKHGGREKYLERLKEYYNGYYFTEEKLSVYNTYGILNHFDSSAKFLTAGKRL